MEKWKCEDCEQVFDATELKHEKECIGEYWGAPAYREYDVCPHCGSEELYKVWPCMRCGEYTETGDYCEICEDDLFG